MEPKGGVPMSICTFFGHSECYGLDAAVLRNAIEDLIKQGITEFLVGNHGQFDSMVFSCLQDLSKDYPEISYSVALAYLPAHKEEYDICYVNYKYGGAYKFARLAKKCGLQVLNLGSGDLQ